MASRELQFIRKFLGIPGSFFLFTEYLLTVTQNQLHIIQQAQSNFDVIRVPGQAEACRSAFIEMLHIRDQLKYIMENQMPDANVFRNLQNLCIKYEVIVMDLHNNIVGIPKDPISPYETFETFLTRLVDDISIYPQAKMIANALVAYYIDYVTVVCRIIERNAQRGRTIGLCRNSLYRILIELNSIQIKIQSNMMYNPINLSTPEARNVDPLYTIMQRCLYLIDTCHQTRPINPMHN